MYEIRNKLLRDAFHRWLRLSDGIFQTASGGSYISISVQVNVNELTYKHLLVPHAKLTVLSSSQDFCLSAPLVHSISHLFVNKQLSPDIAAEMLHARSKDGLQLLSIKSSLPLLSTALPNLSRSVKILLSS